MVVVTTLDFAARNYVENVRREETGISGITYERALRNLVVAMYGHYVDLFRCHSSMAGHRIELAYNYPWKWPPNWVVTTGLSGGRQPGEEFPDWIPTPEIPVGDSRLELCRCFYPAGGMQCIPPTDIRSHWPGLMIRFIMKAGRWETFH